VRELVAADDRLIAKSAENGKEGTTVGKKHRPCLLATLVIVLATSLGLAQDTRSARRSLSELKSLQVKVLTDGPEIDFEALGVSGQQLQTDAELRLRSLAIPLAANDEKAEGYLAISLYLLEDQLRPGYYSYVTKVEVLQPVALQRDETVRTVAVTWSTLKFGFAGRLAVVDLRKDINDLVDQFANAYLEQNPKK
jgi:hypothetical protein